MKISNREIKAVLLAGICLFTGCAKTQQGRGLSGFPVRVGVQGEEPLPVHLHSDVNNTVMVEFKTPTATLPVKLEVGPNEPLPVALLLEDGQVLPIGIKTNVNEPFPVTLEVQPERPLPVNLQNKLLNVELNITRPLPVELNIPTRILVFAGVAIAVILAVCIVISRSGKRKEG